MPLTATPIRLTQFYFTAANFANDTLVYTVTQPKVIIKEIILANVTNADVLISMAVVPQGQTLGAQHYIFLNGKAKREESKYFTGLSTVCNTGDRIYVTSDGPDATINISGVEFTEMV